MLLSGSLILLIVAAAGFQASSFNLSNGRSVRDGGLDQVPVRLYGRKSRSTKGYAYDADYDDVYSGTDGGGGSRQLERNYWDDGESERQQRGGMYKVKFDSASTVDPKETHLDWEVCSDGENEALVLLPPEAVERPTAILHFVGGTFFGSLPRVWYKGLLEGIVRNTQCAVVVTPIPVTLFKSPLDHISLSQKVKASFDNAWISVLEDEYGDLSDMPLCGLGHSLGARLLVVMTTLTGNKAQSPIPAYKSFILVSFTNYGASAGVPGVSTLLRQSKREERRAEVSRERGNRKKARKVNQKWWSDDDYPLEDGEELGELVDDLQNILKEQAARVRRALTPNSKDLEFYPSPHQLWKAIEEGSRYSVSETLLIQFDDDAIDQSVRLASAIQAANSSSLHFARLRGVHLTPLSVDETSDESRMGLSSASGALWKAVKGRGKHRSQESAMRDLRQSVCRYILDVVTK
mmetsp:Transcript_110231/g.318602  ORF Transcript_110231/g.318602 Transcript_110231/m.318602 type:complete len:463 (-) Transcript_110231:5281-6669(-)